MFETLRVPGIQNANCLFIVPPSVRWVCVRVPIGTILLSLGSLRIMVSNTHTVLGQKNKEEEENQYLQKEKKEGNRVGITEWVTARFELALITLPWLQ